MHLRIKILILCASILTLNGCNTPFPQERKTIAYSENDETNGVQGFLDDGSLQINGDARARFNSYVSKYGKDLLPPIGTDFGITPLKDGGFEMTKQAVELWVEMIQMDHQTRINKSK